MERITAGISAAITPPESTTQPTTSNWRTIMPIVQRSLAEAGIDEADPPNWAQAFAKVAARENQRGFCIIGETGSGKTARIQHLYEEMYNDGRSPLYLTAENAILIYGECSPAEYSYHIGMNPPRDLYLDDIGTEQMIVNTYGNRVDVMAQIIIPKRYEAFKQAGVKTYMTTNLNTHELERRYGKRAFSRLQEMCTFLTMRSGDRRKRA